METKGLDVFFKFTVSEFVSWFLFWFVFFVLCFAGFFFAFGVFSLIIREKYLEKEYDVSEIPFSIKALATFIREGFDTEAKLAYKISNSRYTRVQCHLIIAQ